MIHSGVVKNFQGGGGVNNRASKINENTLKSEYYALNFPVTLFFFAFQILEGGEQCPLNTLLDTHLIQYTSTMHCDRVHEGGGGGVTMSADPGNVVGL